VLAAEYADAPVLFLEGTADVSHERLHRWLDSHGGWAGYPAAMVDSGQQTVGGRVDYAARYREMVQTSMAREPGAEVSVTCGRDGDAVAATVAVRNTSGAPLSSENDATVHLLVYEHARQLWTGRTIRGVANASIAGSLGSGATQVFALRIDDLAPDDWAQVRAVALVDYRPDGDVGRYDMLQAAQCDCSGSTLSGLALPLVINGG